MEPQHINQLISQATQPTEQVSIDPEFKTETFGLVRVGNETQEEVESIKNAIKAAQQFLSAIKHGLEPRWLTLTGTPGTGKTHIAREVTKRVKEHRRAFYEASGEREMLSYAQEGPFSVKWIKLVDMARDGDHSPFKRASRDWFKTIDDVGAEGFGQDKLPTQFVIGQWGKLADLRLRKWTVWTTNFPVSDIANLFDVRIADRILREPNIHVDLSHVRSFAIRKLEASK